MGRWKSGSPYHMKIRMLQTRRGSRNGIAVQRFIEGEVYDLNMDDANEANLVRLFLQSGVAEDLEKAKAREAEAEAAEKRAAEIQGSPETKVVSSVDSANKPSEEEGVEVDLEEAVKEFHTGGGWYRLPGMGEDEKVRKDEAIQILTDQE